ncbi:MAG: DUF2306 domain-containing protein [Rhizobiaceae bacterium]|nr:DUF2306 domain-containing protein [Rhizobiaceae bacterium]MCV0405687.1 DUF2306 domain-containing protein [Rhizobiaceae bacterium]
MVDGARITSDTDTSLAPDFYEWTLAVAAAALFLLVLMALVRGIENWRAIEPLVWIHIATVMLPLAITPIQLLRRRGDGAHRALGRIWALSLFMTAMISFGIRDINDGGLSYIHIFSVVTVITVPLLVLAARRHRIARHRNSVRWLVTGALLAAGYFTLIPGRMLGGWLWG